MELVKKTAEHSIWKKRSGKYAITNAAEAFVHGVEKTKILTAEGLAKAPSAKRVKPEGEAPAAT